MVMKRIKFSCNRSDLSLRGEVGLQIFNRVIPATFLDALNNRDTPGLVTPDNNDRSAHPGNLQGCVIPNPCSGTRHHTQFSIHNTHGFIPPRSVLSYQHAWCSSAKPIKLLILIGLPSSDNTVPEYFPNIW